MGRNKDRAVDTGDQGINLDHKDRYGRKLTQKEAFRQMCWKFHGKMPSQRKMEKMRQKIEKETGKTVKDGGQFAKKFEKA